MRRAAIGNSPGYGMGLIGSSARLTQPLQLTRCIAVRTVRPQFTRVGSSSGHHTYHLDFIGMGQIISPLAEFQHGLTPCTQTQREIPLQRDIPPQRHRPPQRNRPPERDTPPQRNRPPERDTPLQRNRPPERDTPPQRHRPPQKYRPLPLHRTLQWYKQTRPANEGGTTCEREYTHQTSAECSPQEGVHPPDRFS